MFMLKFVNNEQRISPADSLEYFAWDFIPKHETKKVRFKIKFQIVR